MSAPIVISEFSVEAQAQLSSEFGNPGERLVSSIALDAEGVDLSRLGETSIVQIATSEQCFIFDVLGKSVEDPIVVWLREILEDDSVIKIIHDCKMDSDALYHHFNIRLANVHDTSCWHSAITGNPDTNLNDVLNHNRLPENEKRDKGIYDRNHRFWATRPLTDQMIAMAAGDLLSLFQLQEQQLQRANDSVAAKASSESEGNLAFARDKQVGEITVTGHMGRFIGPRGSSIRALQTRTGTLIYGKGVRGQNKFMVYYNDIGSFERVKQAAR